MSMTCVETVGKDVTFLTEAPLIPLDILNYGHGINYSLLGCEYLNTSLPSHPSLLHVGLSHGMR
jgi:hypothetical protein